MGHLCISLYMFAFVYGRFFSFFTPRFVIAEVLNPANPQIQMVVVVLAFSSSAKILGECSKMHSLPAGSVHCGSL